MKDSRKRHNQGVMIIVVGCTIEKKQWKVPNAVDEQNVAADAWALFSHGYERRRCRRQRTAQKIWQIKKSIDILMRKSDERERMRKKDDWAATKVKSQHLLRNNKKNQTRQRNGKLIDSQLCKTLVKAKKKKTLSNWNSSNSNLFRLQIKDSAARQKNSYREKWL